MKDRELFDLWQLEENEEIREWSDDQRIFSLEAENVSEGLLVKVLEQSRRELIWGVLLALISVFICRWTLFSLAFMGGTVLLAFAMIRSMQLKLIQKIYSIHQQEVKSAVAEYIFLIAAYRKRIKETTYYFVSTVFYLSILFTFWQYGDGLLSWVKIKKILLTALLVTPLLIGFFRTEFESYLKRHYDVLLQELHSLQQEF